MKVGEPNLAQVCDRRAARVANASRNRESLANFLGEATA